MSPAEVATLLAWMVLVVVVCVFVVSCVDQKGPQK